MRNQVREFIKAIFGGNTIDKCENHSLSVTDTGAREIIDIKDNGDELQVVTGTKARLICSDCDWWENGHVDVVEKSISYESQSEISHVLDYDGNPVEIE